VSMPFYVSPEQIMKDKSDYARKGIARGRSVLVLTYADGVLFVGENPNGALHKISEIYDRIAFAAVGKYNEFENLRLAGVRYADLRGYQYDRRDVTSRGLANAYAQTLGAIFTESGKPYEVEVVVAEVGRSQAEDQIYRLTYDGSVAEEHGFVVMGGTSEPIAHHVRDRHDPSAPLDVALRVGVEALGQASADGEQRTIAAAALEAAVLDRTRPRRAFARLLGPRLERLLAQPT
jgi:proteasome alpha subunit